MTVQITKTQAKGTTTYTYDELNRLSSVTEPEGKVTSYTYDGAGNRKTESVHYGMVASGTLYNYNSQNRLVSTVSLGGEYTKYLYDNNGNLVNKSSGIMKPINADASQTVEDLPQFGLIIKRSNESGTGSENITLYTYNNYNRLISTKSKGAAASYITDRVITLLKDQTNASK